MRLLVTNDDGIASPFLQALVRALQSRDHELFVVAPQHEQSWTGASKSRHRAVASARADRNLGCPTWVVDGTPSDCVNIALAHLLPRNPSGHRAAIDGVVSGLNLGSNITLGLILASGTVAAAWEGTLHGLPAIAYSQHLDPVSFQQAKTEGRISAELEATLKASAERAAALTGSLLESTRDEGFTVHNLNFPTPCRADTPIVRTVPAWGRTAGLFSPADGEGTHRFVFSHAEDVSPNTLTTDKAAIDAGKISHSVLDYKRLGV